jgi:hypothetical protein
MYCIDVLRMRRQTIHHYLLHWLRYGLVEAVLHDNSWSLRPERILGCTEANDFGHVYTTVHIVSLKVNNKSLSIRSLEDQSV